jgi:hypothetical protein
VVPGDSVRRRLKAVDPNLKIIPGGRRRHMTKRDWDRAGGITCASCGRETVNILGGLCPCCHREVIAKREQQQEYKAERRYFQRRLTEGTISLTQLKEGRL